MANASLRRNHTKAGSPATRPLPASPAPDGTPRWFFTMHALQRMAEMAVPRSDVLAALNEPEVNYPAQGGRRMAVRGRLAVLSAGEVIVTVLWHTSEIYHRADSPLRPLRSARRPSQPLNRTGRKFPDESAA